MSKIKGYLFLLYVAVVIPIFILLVKISYKNSKKIRKLVAISFIKIFGFRYEIEGEMDKEAQCLLINHQSYLDVIFLEAIHDQNLCWIAKKELGETPIYGHALKAPKMILIDREDKKGLIYLLKAAKKRLDEGRVLSIFPEGTRGDGSKFLPFKPGAKMIVKKYNLKVQPVLLINTKNAMDSKNFTITDAPFKALFLESFTPQNEDWYERLKEQMEERYNNELANITSNR